MPVKHRGAFVVDATDHVRPTLPAFARKTWAYLKLAPTLDATPGRQNRLNEILGHVCRLFVGHFVEGGSAESDGVLVGPDIVHAGRTDCQMALESRCLIDWQFPREVIGQEVGDLATGQHIPHLLDTRSLPEVSPANRAL